MQKDMSTKLCLIASNSLLFVLWLLSAIRGGVAYTGRGIPIPDTGLTIPFIVYLLFSAVQFVYLNKHKTTTKVLCGVKAVVCGFLIFVICGHAFSAGFIQSNGNGVFENNVWYTVLVAAFIAIVVVSLIAEIWSFSDR